MPVHRRVASTTLLQAAPANRPAVADVDLLLVPKQQSLLTVYQLIECRPSYSPCTSQSASHLMNTSLYAVRSARVSEHKHSLQRASAVAKMGSFLPHRSAGRL